MYVSDSQRLATLLSSLSNTGYRRLFIIPSTGNEVISIRLHNILIIIVSLTKMQKSLILMFYNDHPQGDHSHQVITCVIRLKLLKGHLILYGFSAKKRLLHISLLSWPPQGNIVYCFNFTSSIGFSCLKTRTNIWFLTNCLSKQYLYFRHRTHVLLWII